MNKLMIAMSGGVDSAVAASIAQKSAPLVAGVTMNLCFDDLTNACASSEDEQGAELVCRMLGIPHFVARLGKEFYQSVVCDFISAYHKGLTPNPCVVCNRTIKFGALFDFAKAQGYDGIATGHYARIEKAADGRALLRRALDLTKDQSYVLYSLSQDVLKHTLFPLGELSKAQVRELAQSLNFPMAKKKDSQDICFIPDGDYAAFIARHSHTPVTQGDFIDREGRVIGRHNGMIHYTIGQRKGLGLAMGHPVFVTAKSAEQNTVTVGEHEELFSRTLCAKNINLIPFDRMSTKMKLQAKVRYRQEAVSATVEQIGDDCLFVEFDTPQRAISPGQSLVLYEDDYVIGGGIIQP